MAAAKFQTIDEYIATFPADVQEILSKIRRTIQEAAPEAKEKISYQMPAFTLDGSLVYFAAWQNHIGFYGMYGAAEALKTELAPYSGPKGNLIFPLDKPIPFALIGDIVRFRAKENAEKAAAKRARR